MIEKMKFISITGPKNEFDRVVNVYLNKYEIHLENALTELSSVSNLKPFVEINPYKDLLGKSEELLKRIDRTGPYNKKDMSIEEASSYLNSVLSQVENLNSQKRELKAERSHLYELIKQLEPFRHLNYEINKILNFKFIKFRFGRISHEYYNKFSKHVYDNLTTLFIECDRDSQYVWGVYFVPEGESAKVDAIFSSLHFEKMYLPNEYPGTPEEAYNAIIAKQKQVSDQINNIRIQIKNQIESIRDDILSAYNALVVFSKNFDVRKMAACTKKKDESNLYFILCGWLTEANSNKIVSDMEKEKNVYCIVEDNHTSLTTKPPTKLRNLKIFKPFEMYIKMYGTPAYNEIDPTFFVAITYSLLFGMMFGDVGQGICLILGGALIYKLKKSNLAAIIASAGIFSTIFGFLYGSIFGYENVIPHLWLNPMENVMTVLLTAVAFGVFLIIIAMILNIINGIKSKDIERVLFDTNGISGLVFYGAAISCIALVATGKALPATIILVIFFVIPLLLIFFKEPLTHIIEKKSKILPDSKIMFFVESLFELIEILLSYVTNTISFLRVGAFAMSHVAMMGVVMLLGKAESADPNILVIILGNIFVAGMEGLIVGIQVLRLEYYEMFSRFYKGTGKEFKPFKNK